MRYVESKHNSAYVILDRKREHVATVTVQFPRDGAGRVLVNVRNITCDAQQRTADRYAATYGKRRKGDGADMDGLHLWMQDGSASGYGYDKQTAALAGLIVDGHTLGDHCGTVPEDEKKRERLMWSYIKAAAAGDSQEMRESFRAKAEKIGARFANWSREEKRYTSLYFEPGLRRLEMLGYTVINAI